MTEMLYLTNRNDWRAWLRKNHNTRKEVWLVYYKKHTHKPRIPYENAVEEALCFGWIDSTIKKIDDQRFAQNFTPRKSNSKWSELNKKRARKMIRKGKMTEAGLTKINVPLKNDVKESKKRKPGKKLIVPSYLKEALMTSKNVWKNFNNLAPSYKRLYVGWITSPKKEETRKRRLKEAIEYLKQNKKLGMK